MAEHQTAFQSAVLELTVILKVELSKLWSASKEFKWTFSWSKNKRELDFGEEFGRALRDRSSWQEVSKSPYRLKAITYDTQFIQHNYLPLNSISSAKTLLVTNLFAESTLILTPGLKYIFHFITL